MQMCPGYFTDFDPAGEALKYKHTHTHNLRLLSIMHVLYFLFVCTDMDFFCLLSF